MQFCVINARISCMSRSENSPFRKHAQKAVFWYTCINKIVSLSLLRKNSQRTPRWLSQPELKIGPNSPQGGKMRDPGNEVGLKLPNHQITIHPLLYLWLHIMARWVWSTEPWFVVFFDVHKCSQTKRAKFGDHEIVLWPFESLCGGQFTLSTQLIKPNYLVILPQRSTTVSLETYPLLFMIL